MQNNSHSAVPPVLTEKQLAGQQKYMEVAEDFFRHKTAHIKYDSPQQMAEDLQRFKEHLGQQDFGALISENGMGVVRVKGSPDPKIVHMNARAFFEQELAVFEDALKTANTKAGNWASRLRGNGKALLERATENMTGGSMASQVARGAGVGLGAAYTFGGVSKLFTPKRQVVMGDETVDVPAPSKMGALLQIAAGTGVVAASLFMKGKGASASL